MSQLRHPNIVQIFDFNVAPDGRPYFVMEHLAGARSGGAAERRAAAAARDHPHRRRGGVGARARARARRRSPRSQAGERLPGLGRRPDRRADQGARLRHLQGRRSAAQISHAVDVLGTPSYMAPEQARGQAAAIDGRTDQFALGALAYRMLTGQEPFQGEDTASVLYQVVHRGSAAAVAVPAARLGRRAAAGGSRSRAGQAAGAALRRHDGAGARVRRRRRADHRPGRRSWCTAHGRAAARAAPRRRRHRPAAAGAHADARVASTEAAGRSSRRCHRRPHRRCRRS